MSRIRVVVDKNLTVQLSGEGLTRPLFERIARKCHHLVFVRRLAEGPRGRRMPPRATMIIQRLFRDFRDENGNPVNKLVPECPNRGVLPRKVRSVANRGKSGNPDDYVLEEAAIHDVRYVVTEDRELKTNLDNDSASVRWLKDRRIQVLTAAEYLSLLDQG